MRIVFCGTPEFAVPPLRALIAAPDMDVAAVVTQPDRPSGRGQKMQQSAVKLASTQAGILPFQPAKVKADEGVVLFSDLRPDVVVIIAYGQIIPRSLIVIPRLGWINVHASLLPKYRGAAPIQHAIINGETTTGLTTMLIDAGLDSGPILETLEMKIGPEESAPELSARLSEASGPLLLSTLRKLDSAKLTPRPQDGSLATLAPLLTKADGRIQWSRPAPEIFNRIRGLLPWPGAFTTFRGEYCAVWGKPMAEPGTISGATLATASGADQHPQPGLIVPRGDEFLVVCGEGTALRLEAAQVQSRRRISAADFFRGARLTEGEAFV
jgi:methionyl-tRNA formyltransferase